MYHLKNEKETPNNSRMVTCLWDSYGESQAEDKWIKKKKATWEIHWVSVTVLQHMINFQILEY